MDEWASHTRIIQLIIISRAISIEKKSRSKIVKVFFTRRFCRRLWITNNTTTLTNERTNEQKKIRQPENITITTLKERHSHTHTHSSALIMKRCKNSEFKWNEAHFYVFFWFLSWLFVSVPPAVLVYSVFWVGIYKATYRPQFFIQSFVRYQYSWLSLLR